MKLFLIIATVIALLGFATTLIIVFRRPGKTSGGGNGGKWQAAPFSGSVCSLPCGGGKRYRNVWCELNGKKVDNKYCSGPEPTTEESCNTQPCPPDLSAFDGKKVKLSFTATPSVGFTAHVNSEYEYIIQGPIESATVYTGSYDYTNKFLTLLYDAPENPGLIFSINTGMIYQIGNWVAKDSSTVPIVFTISNGKMITALYNNPGHPGLMTGWVTPGPQQLWSWDWSADKSVSITPILAG